MVTTILHSWYGQVLMKLELMLSRLAAFLALIFLSSILTWIVERERLERGIGAVG